MSFDLGTGDLVPLDGLVPPSTPNGPATPTTRGPGTAAVRPPVPATRVPDVAPAAAAESVPAQGVGREVPKAPRLRPNRLQWRGRLASDPAVRRSKTGIDYCAVRIVQDVLDSQHQPVTQAIEVIVFRERARDFARAFQKGDLVEVMGELRIREWQDKSGARHTNVSLHPSEEIALISRPQKGPSGTP